MSTRGSFVNPPQLGVQRPGRSLSNPVLSTKSVIPDIPSRRKSTGTITAEKELNKQILDYIDNLKVSKNLGEQILRHMRAYRKYYPKIALNNLENIANYLKINPTNGIQSRNLSVTKLPTTIQGKLEKIKTAAIIEPHSLSQTLSNINY